MVNTFQQLKDDPTLPRAYLVEIKPYDPVGAAEVRVGFSDGSSIPHYDGFLWEARLVVNFRSTLNLSSSTIGLGDVPSPSFGNVSIAFETDSVQDSTGALIDLTSLEYDGRDITLYMGDPDGTFADFGILFSGRLGDVIWTDKSLDLIIADPGIMFDTPIQENVFAGTGGFEGGSDLKDEVKPLLFGERKNLAPILTDAADRIYVIHDGSVNSIDDVFDRGVQLTNAGDITTLSLPALENWTPEGGKYVTDLANGAFRLGAEPDGPVTVDAKGDDSPSYINKIAGIAQRIIENQTDLVSADIDTTAVSNFNTDRPGASGIYITAQSSVKSVLTQLIGQVGGSWYFADDGKWTPIVPKFGTSQATIIEDDLVSLSRRQTANPVWRVKVGYDEVGVVQDLSTLDLPSQAISDPFNLFGANANVQQTGLTFTYYDKKLLADLDLAVADIISSGVWIQDPTSDVDNARIRIRFFDNADVQVGSDFEGNFIDGAASFVRTVVEDITIPSGATKITIDVLAASGGGDVLLERAMFNRGTVAQPFVTAIGGVGSQDAVDFKTEVTGAEKPEDNADVTIKRMGTLLKNGDFEAGFDGWVNSNDAVISTAEKHSGTQSARFTESSTGAKGMRSSRIPAKAGDRFLATCWAKRDEADLPDKDFLLSYIELDGSLTDLEFVQESVSADKTVSGWQFLRAIWSPDNANTEFIEIEPVVQQVAAGLEGSWFFDDFAITAIPKDVDIDALATTNAPAEAGANVTLTRLGGNLLANGGFETGDFEGWDRPFGSSLTTIVATSGGMPGSSMARIDVSNQADRRLEQRVPVGEGDRVLAQCLALRDSGALPNREVRWTLDWLDASDALVGSRILLGNTTDQTSAAIQQLRGHAKAPTNAVTARLQLGVSGGTAGTGGWFIDGCHAHILPRDIDLDAFVTPNALLAGIAQEQSAGGDTRILTLGMATGQANDQDTFTFSPARQNIPVVAFDPGGRQDDAGLTTPTYRSIKAINLSVSGFTAELKLKETVGGGTLHTDTGATTGGTQDFEMDKSQSAEAFDDNYLYQFDWTATGGGTPSEPDPGQITVGLFTDDGVGGWIQRGSKSLLANGDQDRVVADDTKQINVDGLGQHAGKEFGMSVTDTIGPGGSLDAFDSVKYTTSGVPATATLTPTDVPKIAFTIFDGEESTVS